MYRSGTLVEELRPRLGDFEERIKITEKQDEKDRICGRLCEIERKPR
jgi:hypothetical protein